MMKKILSIFLVLVLSVSGLVINSVNAQAPYEVVDVDIDGTDMNDVNTLYVERGDTLNIRVEIQSNDNWPQRREGADIVWNTNHIEKDVKIKAEIAGYEYGDIEDVSDMFDIEYGVRYVEYLKLEVPEDINSNENYRLKIRAYNQENEVSAELAEFPLMLKIKSQRHLLNIMDVIFTPGLNLNADQPLFTTVRVENLGDKKEEDIKVTVSVPQLGRTGVTYINELVPTETSDNNNDYQTSESSDAVYLDLRGAQPGTYNLIVKVDYNRGHSELTKNYQLIIGGGVPAGTQENLIVDSAEKTKSAEAGEGIVYKIDIANMGVNARIFTAEVSGLDWGSYRVDPTISIVQPGSTGEMFVYVSPNSDVTGQKTFTVNVKEGNNVVKQISFQTNVAEAKGEWDNVLTGLEIGFVVLLIILVILGIILAATKMGKKENEEPLGESYY